jgi:hypothetical protein
LALVAGQDVEPGDSEGRGGSPSAPRRIGDLHRRSRQSDTSTRPSTAYRDGYKAHVVVEPTTGLICACNSSPPATPPTAQPASSSWPTNPTRQVLADSAYGSGETRAALAKRRHTVWRSSPGRPPTPAGSDATTSPSTTPPAPPPAPPGHTVAVTRSNNAVFGQRCRGCPLRSRCTTARDGRILTLHDHDAELVEARRAWRDGEFADDYRQFRPMVERSLAWLVRPGRRVAYRGIARNRIWLAHRAAAVNLQRLVNLGLTHHDGWQLAT